jgi:hypothetical protein
MRHPLPMRQRQSRRQVRVAVIALTATLLACGRASPAGADGDPASDVLLVQNVFYPYQPKVSGSLERSLEGVLASVARSSHVPFKVAIIRTAPELGLVPQYFGHPQAYASFLDREISFNTAPQPLITVMPSGFGVIPARYAPVVGHLPVNNGEGSDGLTRSTIAAIVALSRSLGHPVSAPHLSPATASSSSPGLVVFVVPVALLLIGGLVLALRRSAGAHGDATDVED